MGSGLAVTGAKVGGSVSSGISGCGAGAGVFSPGMGTGVSGLGVGGGVWVSAFGTNVGVTGSGTGTGVSALETGVSVSRSITGTGVSTERTGVGGRVSGMLLVPGSVVWSEETPAGASGVTTD